MSLKLRGSSETEKNLEGIIRGDDDHCLQRAPARLPSASSAARRLLLLPAMVLGAALVIGKASLGWQRLKAKGLVNGWGHLRFYL
jgi:hypothetical protein